MYNEQTNAHLIDILLYCSLFIAATCFNANGPSSGSSYSVPAKFNKRVHAVLDVFLSNSHIRFLESLKH
jgi:vancomycin permeability regulator SanA